MRGRAAGVEREAGDRGGAIGGGGWRVGGWGWLQWVEAHNHWWHEGTHNGDQVSSKGWVGCTCERIRVSGIVYIHDVTRMERSDCPAHLAYHAHRADGCLEHWRLSRATVSEVCALCCALLLPGTQKVHSFDLVAAAPHVVACNMAHVPLPDASADVAVFSLALMGTDYGSFLVEAARVVRHKGWIWLAEVGALCSMCLGCLWGSWYVESGHPGLSVSL